jgi:hypothetical protein
MHARDLGTLEIKIRCVFLARILLSRYTAMLNSRKLGWELKLNSQ